GGYPGTAHCKPDELLADDNKLRAYNKAIDDRGLTISALSVHGNPLHPQKDIAKGHHDDFVKTVQLARKLDVGVVNLFSGCPGDHEGAKYPNWPVAPWPEDFREVFNWQWDEKIIPYWTEQGRFAEQHGVKLAFEMHGGFSVHSPQTLMKLRDAVGEVIGANFDPSHMYWQGINPVEAIKYLGKQGALFHFHAKDTIVEQANTDRNGILNMTSYGDMLDRAWYFRTVGYGHDMKNWKDMISALRLVGYDHVISIEHEDGLMSRDEGFEKAIRALQDMILEQPMTKMWWV
ncbi:MAG: sugar phosphate isomerase/epimerase, partial [Bacilli bacterium]